MRTGQLVMAARREDVDLWLVLADPKCARAYISAFAWAIHFPEKPTAIITTAGRRIQLDNMNDEESVVLAMELLRDYEMEVVKAQFLRAEALGEVC